MDKKNEKKKKKSTEENRRNGNGTLRVLRRQRKKGDLSLISTEHFDTMHHHDAPDRAE